MTAGCGPVHGRGKPEINGRMTSLLLGQGPRQPGPCSFFRRARKMAAPRNSPHGRLCYLRAAGCALPAQRTPRGAHGQCCRPGDGRRLSPRFRARPVTPDRRNSFPDRHLRRDSERGPGKEAVASPRFAADWPLNCQQRDQGLTGTGNQSDLSRQWDEEHDQHVVQRLLDQIEHVFTPPTWQAFRRVVLDGVSPAVAAAELGLTRTSSYSPGYGW